jgi:hypothetical protein
MSTSEELYETILTKKDFNTIYIRDCNASQKKCEELERRKLRNKLHHEAYLKYRKS